MCDVKLTSPAIGCPVCLAKTGVTELWAAVQHTDVVSRLVAQLKFYGNRSAARLMAQRLAVLFPTPVAGVLITNVPATNQHIRERGFDQAALLAKELARLTGLPYRSVLRRSGRKHQFGSNKDTRLQQLQGAVYSINPDVINGRCIILVDDVLTTGASITASAQALHEAGARRVDAWVFARAGRQN